MKVCAKDDLKSKYKSCEGDIPTQKRLKFRVFARLEKVCKY